MIEYTDAQILAAISSAIRAHDLKAAAGLVGLLALQNPAEAERIRSAVLLLTPANQQQTRSGS